MISCELRTGVSLDSPHSPDTTTSRTLKCLYIAELTYALFKVSLSDLSRPITARAHRSGSSSHQEEVCETENRSQNVALDTKWTHFRVP